MSNKRNERVFHVDEIHKILDTLIKGMDIELDGLLANDQLEDKTIRRLSAQRIAYNVFKNILDGEAEEMTK